MRCGRSADEWSRGVDCDERSRCDGHFCCRYRHYAGGFVRTGLGDADAAPRPAVRPSDVGLHKCCERHQIPPPQAGYWAKKAVGKAPQRPPLTPVADLRLRTIRFGRRNPSQVKDESPKSYAYFDAELYRLAKIEAAAGAPVKVPETLRSPHPIVVRTRAGLIEAARRPNYRNDPIYHAHSGRPK